MGKLFTDSTGKEILQELKSRNDALSGVQGNPASLATTDKSSLVAAINEVHNNASSRLATLEGYNAGTRLTAIETVNTNQATEISNILDRGGFHHSSYRHWELPFHLRGKYLGGTITAAQYDAICGTNGANLFDVQLGDNWTHYATPSTNTAGNDFNWIATVIERTGNGVYLMIQMIDKDFFQTNKHSRIHSTNNTSIGFANTEMWTQNLGLIETWLSNNGFPTQYLKEWSQYYYDLPDSTGAATITELTGKLHLMRICDFSEKDYEATGMKRAEYPYSYFKRVQLKGKFDTMSCDPVSATNYGRCMAIPYVLVTQSQAAKWAPNYLTEQHSRKEQKSCTQSNSETVRN